mmetsp:Transcript_29003/g.50722  ORF Transcript_29003/g.50722 Transcript_29003/m.50722 type:complete len:246 (+) Transcript_29003:354-1091(+)
MALLSFQDNIVAAWDAAFWLNALTHVQCLLDILRELHDLLILPNALGEAGLLAGVGTCRKHGTQLLLTTIFLSCAHLQTSQHVDTESEPILCALVKRCNCRFEGLCKCRRLSQEIGPWMQDTTGCRKLQRHAPAGEIDRTPRGREQRSGLARRELVAVEMLLAHLPHSVFDPEEGAQLLHARVARVREDEAITFQAPVGEVWVEDVFEQLLVFLVEDAGTTINTRPETSTRHRCSVQWLNSGRLQ